MGPPWDMSPLPCVPSHLGVLWDVSPLPIVSCPTWCHHGRCLKLGWPDVSSEPQDLGGLRSCALLSTVKPAKSQGPGEETGANRFLTDFYFFFSPGLQVKQQALVEPWRLKQGELLWLPSFWRLPVAPSEPSRQPYVEQRLLPGTPQLSRGFSLEPKAPKPEERLLRPPRARLPAAQHLPCSGEREKRQPFRRREGPTSSRRYD